MRHAGFCFFLLSEKERENCVYVCAYVLAEMDRGLFFLVHAIVIIHCARISQNPFSCAPTAPTVCYEKTRSQSLVGRKKKNREKGIRSHKGKKRHAPMDSVGNPGSLSFIAHPEMTCRTSHHTDAPRNVFRGNTCVCREKFRRPAPLMGNGSASGPTSAPTQRQAMAPTSRFCVGIHCRAYHYGGIKFGFGAV